jgi:hypothetical protein
MKENDKIIIEIIPDRDGWVYKLEYNGHKEDSLMRYMSRKQALRATYKALRSWNHFSGQAQKRADSDGVVRY